MELVRCQACIYIQFVCIHVFFSHVRVRCIVDGCHVQYAFVCVYSLTTLFAQFFVCLFVCLFDFFGCDDTLGSSDGARCDQMRLN